MLPLTNTPLQPQVIDTAPASPGEFHSSVVVDRHTPLRPDGQALFKPVWTQMCLP